MDFEYVLSGMRYTVGPVYFHFPEVKSLYKNYFTKKSNGIEVSCLYNAWTEKELGKILKDEFSLPKVYADSGGLQMALYEGDADDSSERAKIYDVQKESHFAFCFDDIPVKMTEVGRSARVLVTNKYFDTSLLKEKALKTANNIKEQIAYFNSHQSNTKIFAIIQGNCAKTFTEWGNYLFSYLTEEELDSIFGIALADTCAGNGILESIQMSKALIDIEAPERIKKNVHYLGVGSMTRMMPIIELSHTPLLKGRHISFDSTTHTSSFVMGKYFDDNLKNFKLGKNRNHLQDRVIEEIVAKWFPDKVDTDMVKMLLENIGTFSYLREESDLQSSLVCFMAAYVFEMVDGFTKSIKNAYDDYNTYGNYLRNNRLLVYMSQLRKIKTVEEFDDWVDQFSYLIPSNPIAASKPSSLGAFLS